MTALCQYYNGDYNAFVDALASVKLSLRQAAVVSRCWSKITGSGQSSDTAPTANFIAAFKDEEKAKSILALFPSASA